MTHRMRGFRRVSLATVSLVALLVTGCYQQETGGDLVDGRNGLPPIPDDAVVFDADKAGETTASRQEPTGIAELDMMEALPGTITNQLLSQQPTFGGQQRTVGALALNSQTAEEAPYAPPPQAGDIDRERYEAFDRNGVMAVSDTPVSTFSIDVDTASYGLMRRYLRDGVLPPQDAIRPEEVINYFSYDYVMPDSEGTPFATSVAVTPTPWNENTQLLHIGIQGYDIVQEERPRSNIVFLLDVSGSMSDPDKLPLLQRAMKLLIGELGADDQVAIVTYAGNAGTVLEPTSGDQHSRIQAAIDALGAGGSTAGAAGIQAAYQLAEQSFIEDGVNRVILATDGDFNVGIADPERLEDFVAEKRESDIYLSVLGFGRGNYNDVMMQKLAQAGNGNAAYIDTLQEARKVLVDEFASTLFTIANDVKIQVEFNPSRVSEYRLIGYETRALRREDFSNDAVDAGDIGSGHTVTAIYEIVQTGTEGGLLEPLRYQDPAAESADPNAEFAFIRIRYKEPGEDTSQLIEQAVDNSFVHEDFAASPQYARFATAVAAMAQKLNGTTYLDTFSYDEIANIAAAARGDDPFGYRNEFLQLVRLADSADALPPQGGFEASWLK
jgi:Ca-activated chloride channel family protein